MGDLHLPDAAHCAGNDSKTLMMSHAAPLDGSASVNEDVSTASSIASFSDASVAPSPAPAKRECVHHRLSAEIRRMRLGHMPTSFLSAEDETALFSQFKVRADGSVSGCKQCYEAVILFYRPYALKMAARAAKIHNMRDRMDDLRAEAEIGIIEAIPKFDPKFGTRFATLARNYMLTRTSTFAHSFKGPTRIGTNSADKKLITNFNRMAADIERRTGHKLTDEGRQKIAEDLRVPIAAVKRIEALLTSSVISLDAPLSDKENSRAIDITDNRPNPELIATQERDNKLLRQVLCRCIAELPDAHRTIVLRRNMGGKKMKMDDLATMLGFKDRGEVSSREKEALGILKNMLMKAGVEVQDIEDNLITLAETHDFA